MIISSLDLIYLLTLFGCVLSLPTLQEKKKFALEDIIPLRSDLRFGVLTGKWITAKWTTDKLYVFLDLKTQNSKIFNAQTKEVENFTRPDLILPKNSFISSFSPDEGKYILVMKNDEKVFRRSTVAEYDVVELATNEMYPVAKGQRLKTCLWSPAGGGAVAYVKDNDVFFIPNITDPSSTKQLTTDGKIGEIYNGVADWIYEEEVLNSADAMWFSKKGSNLAVATFNDTEVDVATYPIYGPPSNPDNQYPVYSALRYPKVGRKNPKVSLNVYLNIAGDPSIFNIQPPNIDNIQEDPILGAVNWITDDDISVLWLNRRQNMSALMICHIEISKAACYIHNVSEEPNGWIDITPIMFSSDGSKFITIKPRPFEDDRYPHLVKEDLKTRVVTDLTPAKMTVHSILGWHEPTDTVFYSATPADTPWDRQLWASTPLGNRCVSCSVEGGCPTAEAKFSPSSTYGTLTCSSHGKPPYTFMYDLLDNTLSPWTNNSAVEKVLSTFEYPDVKHMILELSKDLKAHVSLMLPPNMEADKKYPLVVNVYAGPGSIKVMDNFKLDYQTYLTSNRSYIVCYTDVRGSGALGIEALHSINHGLGTYEITDTIDVIKTLLKRYDFIDPERVGVWGWSYGGYAAAMILAKSDPGLIKCAVSVAPVTSWLYYDSIYTERYMDTPQNNMVGYNRSDVILHASRFKGKNFLLIHGSADDNVHYQNSMMLSKELQHRDIDFEEMSYADEAHSLAGVLPHVYHTIDHFFGRCLG